METGAGTGEVSTTQWEKEADRTRTGHKGRHKDDDEQDLGERSGAPGGSQAAGRKTRGRGERRERRPGHR